MMHSVRGPHFPPDNHGPATPTDRSSSAVATAARTAPRSIVLPTISVIVPVYNSARTLTQLIERLRPVLERHADRFEVVLVNDASRDESWQAVLTLAQSRPWVRGISLMRNFGQHNTLLCGIRAARYDLIVTLDDDLQNPPEEIPVLLEELARGCDVVYGTPQKLQHGLLRNLASQITKIVLQQVMGAEVARNVSAFRVFRTRLREAFANFNNPYVSIDVLLTWGTTRFAAVRVKHDERTVGKSNYTIWKLFNHAMNMITGFSTLPLRAASLLGFASTGFGLLLLAYTLGCRVIFGMKEPGFTFLASAMAIFSGAQLLALGIFGEYLARIHCRMQDRPTYVVREEENGSRGVT